MTRLILGRVAQAALVVAIVVVATFVLIRLAPGDPFAAIADDPDLAPGVAESLRRQYGLDEPLPTQFVRFVVTAARGELWSTSHSDYVSSVLARVVPNTLLLTATAFFVAFVGGVAIGAWQGWRPDAWFSRATDRLGLVIVAIPEFILALLLVLGPALTWEWFPPGRMRSAVAPGGLAGVLDVADHLVLPTLALALVIGAVVARHQRAAMAAVHDREFIRAARAKGVPEPRLFVRHALRNALVPILTLAGVALPTLVGGAVLVETVFDWPGMGAVAVEATRSRDYHLVVACVLVSTVAVVLANLAADLALLWADPRLRDRR